MPRREVERRTDLKGRQRLPRGGHFLPSEQPELLAAECRSYFSEDLGLGGGSYLR